LLQPLAQDSSAPAAAQELARAYNDLANVRRFQDRDAEAEPLFQKAIALDQHLTAQYPDNREYKFELANFLNNLALLLVDQNKPELARNWNQHALDLLGELARPAPSLSLELVRTYNLAAQAGSSPAAIATECQKSREVLDQLSKEQDFRRRSELSNLYRDLGYDYLQLADVDLQVHSVGEAKRALQECSSILPELSDTDRSTLTEQYDKVRKKLAGTR